MVFLEDPFDYILKEKYSLKEKSYPDKKRVFIELSKGGQTEYEISKNTGIPLASVQNYLMQFTDYHFLEHISKERKILTNDNLQRI
jgi:hypothetical protein